MIPLNFVIGAAAGAVTTYVLKDNSAKEWAKNTGNKIKSSASSVTSSVTSIFKKKSKEDVAKTTEDATTEGEVIEGKAKDVTMEKPATSV